MHVITETNGFNGQKTYDNGILLKGHCLLRATFSVECMNLKQTRFWRAWKIPQVLVELGFPKEIWCEIYKSFIISTKTVNLS